MNEGNWHVHNSGRDWLLGVTHACTWVPLLEAWHACRMGRLSHPMVRLGFFEQLDDAKAICEADRATLA